MSQDAQKTSKSDRFRELLAIILDLQESGLSRQEIVNILKNDHDFEISVASFGVYLKRSATAKTETPLAAPVHDTDTQAPIDDLQSSQELLEEVLSLRELILQNEQVHAVVLQNLQSQNQVLLNQLKTELASYEQKSYAEFNQKIDQSLEKIFRKRQISETYERKIFKFIVENFWKVLLMLITACFLFFGGIFFSVLDLKNQQTKLENQLTQIQEQITPKIQKRKKRTQ